MKIIITEKQYDTLRLRRIVFTEFPKYITSAYKWLNPKSFNNFEEFLERVIFSSSGDFVASNIYTNPENYDSIRNEFEKTATEIIMNGYYDEILEYYNSEV